MNTIDDVKAELTGLKELGVRVPRQAFAYIDAHKAEITEMRENGARISDIADTVILTCL